MLAYIARRLLLVVPTLFGIMVINFLVIQSAPGGPVEQLIQQLTEGGAPDVTARVSGTATGDLAAGAAARAGGEDITGRYRGARGLDPEFVKEIERMYGFDKPLHERFFQMMGQYLRFDFGTSYFRDQTVVDLVLEKMPVSISLGIWTTLLTYLISIPLGIRKAVRDGSRFDVWTSGVVILGNAIPGFLFAILLIVLFAGGSFLDWFPLRGLVSDNWEQLSWPERIVDYFWHLTLPLVSLIIGAFAGMTMLTKNSFLEEINKQYVMTARAKGLSERRVLYGHVFRNGMLIVIAGFPGAFVGILFTGAMLIEIIFSLDGLGLLGFEAALKRDYPVMFASLYFFGLLGLIMQLISDLMYVAIDPRIDFESREVCMATLAEPRPRTRERLLGVPLRLNPTNQRRLANFRANRRGYLSLHIFLALFVLALGAELIANDKPFLIWFDDRLYFPFAEAYPETTFGGDFPTEADYRDPFVAELIAERGWMLWPPIPYSYDTVILDLPGPAPSPPSWQNLLGTDDQARDVLARVIYGFRISVLFGLALTLLSSLVGVIAGAVQGYYGGWVDLLFQRFIEIWTSMPTLFLLIILASVVTPNFWWLLGLLLLFSWTALVGVVRAEFLRARNFDFVRAARALGVGHFTIMLRHILPNAMVATLTFMPFILIGGITSLTGLDFLGFGLPAGSPSLGELLAQGKNNLQAPWLGISGFVVMALMLSLLVFIGEAVRDAFDPRKTFR